MSCMSEPSGFEIQLDCATAFFKRLVTQDVNLIDCDSELYTKLIDQSLGSQSDHHRAVCTRVRKYLHPIFSGMRYLCCDIASVQRSYVRVTHPSYSLPIGVAPDVLVLSHAHFHDYCFTERPTCYKSQNDDLTWLRSFNIGGSRNSDSGIK